MFQERKRRIAIKKILYMFLVLALAAGLADCGTSGGSGESSDFTWTREGTFADGSGNYLLISPANDEEHEGQWAVTAMMAEETHGWFLTQEGESLHGNLDTEYDDFEGDYIVTITEEGEDGVAMAVEGGDTYHFAKEETPEVIATMKINTEGLGQFAYAPEGEDVEFDEEFPTQSAIENLPEPKTFVIKAKPDEGWKFVKWTKDGEDFSTDTEITVDVAEDVEYIAVFNIEE